MFWQDFMEAHPVAFWVALGSAWITILVTGTGILEWLDQRTCVHDFKAFRKRNGDLIWKCIECGKVDQ